MTVFGVHVGLQHTTADELRGVWRRIEDLGFGWISVWDHFYGATGRPDELLAVLGLTDCARRIERTQLIFASTPYTGSGVSSDAPSSEAKRRAAPLDLDEKAAPLAARQTRTGWGGFD